jgi:hypothetical protein
MRSSVVRKKATLPMSLEYKQDVYRVELRDFDLHGVEGRLS